MTAPLPCRRPTDQRHRCRAGSRIGGVAAAGPAGPAAVVAHAGLDGHRGRCRDRRGHRGRVGGPARVRPGQRHRGHRQHHRDLAVHGTRLASATAERRAQQLVAVSFFLLAPHRRRGGPGAGCRRARRDQRRRPCPHRRNGDPRARPRDRQAAHRRPPRLTGDRRRRHPEPAVRLPRHGRVRGAGRQHAARRLVARRRRRPRDLRLGGHRRTPSLGLPVSCSCATGPGAAGGRCRRRRLLARLAGHDGGTSCGLRARSPGAQPNCAGCPDSGRRSMAGPDRALPGDAGHGRLRASHADRDGGSIRSSRRTCSAS